MSVAQKGHDRANFRPSLGRRLEAWLAIAALLGALAAVGFGVIEGDLWRPPVALVAVIVTVVGLWYLVSRRGPLRFIGAVLAGVGIATLLAAIFSGHYRGVPVIVAVILMAISATAARYALHGNHRTAATETGRGGMVGPGSHPVLLMNPKSGGGKVERFQLVDECVARGIEPVVLQPGDDLLQLATDAIQRGADIIGMAGGDGSQALVASVAAAHGIPHVCVPAGTRNHFALDLGLNRDDVVGALDAFRDAVERRVDLARVNGRVFVNNACMGLYAKIVQSDEYRDAKLKTAADMLPDLLGSDASPFDLEFADASGQRYPSAHILLVSNNPYELVHLGGFGTRKRIDLGTLGIVAARIDGPREAVAFVGLEAAGRVRSFSGWLEWDTPTFRVESAAPIEIGIDGEAMSLDPPLVFESLPGALRVRIPTHAPGVAPAATAVRLTASTIRDLARTAVGRPVEAV
jgi:diacylglycerol kinase family enzyme